MEDDNKTVKPTRRERKPVSPEIFVEAYTRSNADCAATRLYLNNIGLNMSEQEIYDRASKYNKRGVNLPKPQRKLDVSKLNKIVANIQKEHAAGEVAA